MNSSTSSFRAYVAVLLLFSGAVFLAGLAASEWLVRTRVEPNDQLPAHLRLFHSTHEASVGFGDSHMACGFSPPAGMVNLAFPGENIETIAYKAGTYFSRRVPGRVIVQAEAHMFARYRTAATRGYNELFDQAPDEQPGLSIRALGSYHRPKLFAYWQVLWRKGSFESRSKLVQNGATECNDHWTSVLPEARKTQARERAALHQPADDFARSAFAALYQRLLEGLVSKGARVCLVEFPVSPEYKREMPVESYEAARSWFAAQARRLDLRLLPYAGLYAQTPELFSDMDHLTPQGAARFSQRILDECFK